MGVGRGCCADDNDGSDEPGGETCNLGGSDTFTASDVYFTLIGPGISPTVANWVKVVCETTIKSRLGGAAYANILTVAGMGSFQLSDASDTVDAVYTDSGATFYPDGTFFPSPGTGLNHLVRLEVERTAAITGNFNILVNGVLEHTESFIWESFSDGCIPVKVQYFLRATIIPNTIFDVSAFFEY